MPATSPTHPLSLSTVLVQQPPSAPPALAASPPSVGLRLKTTLHLLVPSLPPPDTRALKPAALAQTIDVWPSRAAGGVVRVGVEMKVRGENVDTRLGWVGERVREAFATNEAALGLAGVSPLAHGYFDLQTTSLPSAADGAVGARPTAVLEALDLHLSWGAKPTKPRVRKALMSATTAASANSGLSAAAGQAPTEDVPMADGAKETDEARAKLELAQLVVEQDQITHDLVTLVTADEPSSRSDLMRRTLDACVLRLFKGHLVKIFPRVFNGPHARLVTSDAPVLPSVAGSMRTIVQSMTDKGRKRAAKALYSALSDDLEQLERQGRQALKDVLLPLADPHAMNLSAVDPASSSSDNDDDGVVQERERDTAADFERVLLGGLAGVWQTGLVPKRPSTIRAPPTPEPTGHSSLAASPPVDPALEPLVDPLDWFDDDHSLNDRFAALEWDGSASAPGADELDPEVSSWKDEGWASPDIEGIEAQH